MDLHVWVAVQFPLELVDCSQGRQLEVGMLSLESDPVESICAWIVNLVASVVMVELLEIFWSKQVIYFGCFEQRVSETFVYLFLKLLLVDQNNLSIV